MLRKHSDCILAAVVIASAVYFLAPAISDLFAKKNEDDEKKEEVVEGFLGLDKCFDCPLIWIAIVGVVGYIAIGFFLKKKTKKTFKAVRSEGLIGPQARRLGSMGKAKAKSGFGKLRSRFGRKAPIAPATAAVVG